MARTARTKRIPPVWRSRLSYRPSRELPGFGKIYCNIYADTYHYSHFSLNIIITKKEWEKYKSVNYFYQTMMPTLGIHYYKFADFMDMVTDTVNASNMKNASSNVMKLMLKMGTMKM